MSGGAFSKAVGVLVGFEVVDGDDPLADHFVELVLERVLVLLAEPWVVVNEVSGNPCDADGLVDGASVDYFGESLP